jgi:TatD DNase family protein
VILRRPAHEGGILLHSYGGPADALEELAGRNVYVSFGGALTRPGGKKIPEAARRAVAGSVVLESDAPDQPPRLPDGCEPFLRDGEGRALSEPSGVVLAGEALAALRGESPEETAAATTEAAMRLFGGLGPRR